MIDSMETVLLIILPWSYVVKSLALGLMWWALDKRTTPTGPLGRRINGTFWRQFIMSLFITWAMFILSSETDASEIDWPFVSVALAGLAIWPLPTAWSYFELYLTYRHIAREKARPWV